MVKQDWELVNPEGVIMTGQNRANPHPADLSGKTVVLHWNGKHNGEVFLNRIAELLGERVKGVKVIRGWEEVRGASMVSQNPDRSRESAQKLAELKPDLVIGAPGD
ncbi:MAG: hypothetical protein ABID87_00630 [Chloroflexota bacterium]